jgi:hypothetical protein
MVRLASVCFIAGTLINCSSGGSNNASSSASASAAAADGSGTTAAASATSTADTSASLSQAALGKLTVGSDSLFQDQGAVVEGFDEGSAAFAFASDGPVKVAVADASGKPITPTDRKATLTYTIPETGKTVEVPLQPDSDKHYLVANGPELSSVVTPVKYQIDGGARPWTGVLQLPAGGTKALNASAQLAATAHATPIVGPHGGRIERIGKDDVELLMDKDSGEVRAWIIVDGKAIDPVDRKFAVVIDDRRLELRADANASFYAHVSTDFGLQLGAIHKVSGELTFGVGASATVSTVLFGLRPNVYVYAPRVVVDVYVDNWTTKKRAQWITHPDDDDRDHDHDHHDNGRHEGWGPDEGHGKHADDQGGDHDHGHDHGGGNGNANGNGNGSHGGGHGDGKSHGGGHGH